MSHLSVNLNGIHLHNPFMIASGPPGTNGDVIRKAHEEGWGAVIAKTISLNSASVTNLIPRYAKLKSSQSNEIIGWENIELISDRPFETWIEEFKKLKDAAPEMVLIASIMEEYRKDSWVEIVERCQEAGVDGLELNFSCPHGHPDQKMGAAMGEVPSIAGEVASWVSSAAKVPVWAKLSPNVAHIEDPARAALRAGCQGISAINTIRSVMEVNLDTLRPSPTVCGYSTHGGYSGIAVRPIALRFAMELARMMKSEFSQNSLLGVGGIETGKDAAQFILLGCHAVQVCTGVMKHGFKMVHKMKDELSQIMEQHQFKSLEEMRGFSLRYFKSHGELVALQKHEKSNRKALVSSDKDWSGEKFVEQTSSLLQ